MVLTNPSIREHGSDLPRLGERTRSILHYGDQLAGRSPHLEALHLQEAPGGRTLPRYRWPDPSARPVYRIGIFAAIHGESPSAVVPQLQILNHLSQKADLGASTRSMSTLFVTLGDSMQTAVKANPARI